MKLTAEDESYLNALELFKPGSVPPDFWGRLSLCSNPRSGLIRGLTDLGVALPVAQSLKNQELAWLAKRCNTENAGRLVEVFVGLDAGVRDKLMVTLA